MSGKALAVAAVIAALVAALIGVERAATRHPQADPPVSASPATDSVPVSASSPTTVRDGGDVHSLTESTLTR
jgi:hypothetical protein